VNLDKSVSFTSADGGLDSKNVTIKFGAAVNKLTFNAQGRPKEGGGSIYLKAGRFTQEITVLPVSGRVEIKTLK
jgi:hypothetical protein